SSEHTPYAGIPRASANAAAAAIPTRSPVNGPGPAPTVTASRSAAAGPASARQSTACGESRSAWARPSTVTRVAGVVTEGPWAPDTSRHTPAVTEGAEVSRVRINT